MPVVYLVGFMGCGKSSVGLALAGMLGVRFLDLDQLLVERLGASVAEVFARRGEDVFRREESSALAEVARLDQGVVATGGGTFCSEGNRRLIENSGGLSVYLEVAWPTLLARLPGKQADRPRFVDPDQANQLFLARLPLYRLARHTVTVAAQSTPLEVARQVAEVVTAGGPWPVSGDDG